MAKRTKIVGKCKICGCTDEEGCAIGCWWVTPEQDLCSACKPASGRIDHKRPGRGPKAVPVWGIWVENGGPDNRGYWMCEVCMSDAGEFEHPALFWDLKAAKEACKRENDPGVVGSLAQGGWSCVVVELVATRIVRP